MLTKKTIFKGPGFVPAGFGFGKALARLKEGWLVRRASWPKGVWIVEDDGEIYNGAMAPGEEIRRSVSQLKNQDLLAHDWEVLDVDERIQRAIQEADNAQE